MKKIQENKLSCLPWELESWYKIPKDYPQKYHGMPPGSQGGDGIAYGMWGSDTDDVVSEIGKKLAYSLDLDVIYLGMMDYLKNIIIFYQKIGQVFMNVNAMIGILSIYNGKPILEMQKNVLQV